MSATNKLLLWLLPLGLAGFWLWAVFGREESVQLEAGWLIVFPAVCVLVVSLIGFCLTLWRSIVKFPPSSNALCLRIAGLTGFALFILYLQLIMGELLFDYAFDPFGYYGSLDSILSAVFIVIFLLTGYLSLRYSPNRAVMLSVLLVAGSIIIGFHAHSQGQKFATEMHTIESQEKTLTAAQCSGFSFDAVKAECRTRLAKQTGDFSFCGSKISQENFECFLNKAAAEQNLNACNDSTFLKLLGTYHGASGYVVGVVGGPDFDNEKEACRFELGTWIYQYATKQGQYYQYTATKNINRETKLAEIKKICEQLYGDSPKFTDCYAFHGNQVGVDSK